MRLILFFDLPVVTKFDWRNYSKFRRFLINDGYLMLQLSVYTRIVFTPDAEKKHRARLARNLPPRGSIRLLSVTEKQYTAIERLIGDERFQEKAVGSSQILLF